MGAVLAMQGRIISTGYAGPPAGFDHCTPQCQELGSTGGCQRTLHAETNAIAYAARHGIKAQGSELFVTLSPCVNCAKLVINSGVTKVWYNESYRIPDGIELLERAGIPCEMLTVDFVL